MLRLAPNPRPILVKHKRHRRHQGTQASHDRQRVRHAQVLVKRRSNNHHSSRSDVSDHGDGCERAGGVDFVRVDDVLVAGVDEAWLAYEIADGIRREATDLTNLVMKMHRMP